MHHSQGEKRASSLWRRINEGYELHFRNLFIAEIITLLIWLIRQTYRGFLIIGRGVGRGIAWVGGVSYRLAAFCIHTFLFIANSIGRGSARVVCASAHTTAAVTVKAVHHTRHTTVQGVSILSAVIRAFGLMVLSISIAFIRIVGWVVVAIGRVLNYGVHIIVIRPFLAFVNTLSYFFTSFHPLHPPTGWRRTLTTFVVMAVVLVIPFPALHSLRAMETVKESTVTQAMSGLDSFSKAQDALFNKDVNGAHTYFVQSYQRFLDAEGALVSIPPFLFDVARYIPGMGKQASEGKKLLEAGRELALAGQDLTAAFDPLLNIDALSSRSLLSLSDTVGTSLSRSLPHLEHASALIETIDTSILPEQQRALLDKAQHQLPMVVSTAKDMGDTLALLHRSLGAEEKKRYLVVLQNNTEIRATGGFIGSFALIDIDRGGITSIEIPQGGSYDLQGSLSAHVISPDPLHLVNPQWQFQDANWFPDFPTSAKKLEWFYEKSGGSSVDGVIAINANMGKEILKLTGPIDMPAYGKTIDENNFLLEIQKSVELEYDKGENKPKKLISELVPEVMARLAKTSPQDYGTLVQLLIRSITTNDIQVYLSDAKDQDTLQRLGFGGYVKHSPRDYTMVVDSNVAGGKTDAMIHSKAHELVVINEDGTIDVTMRLWRQHTGVKGEIFTGVNNVDYMRLYTPQGSKLISSRGFTPPDPSLFKNPPIGYEEDSDLKAIQGTVTYQKEGMYQNDEFEKTVFGNWVQTKPGTTTPVEITYRLPFTTKELRTSANTYGYLLFLQRQSASVINDYSVDVVVPPAFDVSWAHPSEMHRTSDGTWHWETSSFEQDALLAFQFTRH